VKSLRCVCVLLTLSLFVSNLFADGHPVTQAKQLDVGETRSSQGEALAGPSQFMIPGPLRPFLRMAGISQGVSAEEVLPLLSRNVFSLGYEGPTRPTEYLVLLRRYVVQARELASLASNSGMIIRISNCADARPLLQILGYRIQGKCGEPGASLQTEDPERAFLSINSGFPLPELERSVQEGKPFDHPFSSSPVPVLFAESDWTKASRKNYKESSLDLIDTILQDQSVARLYWAFSNLDRATAESLRQSVGLDKLLHYAPVLDFYGRNLCISGGRVIVPGGAAAESAWKDLVGASPESPDSFVQKLLAKDKGWLAAYFDALSHVSENRLKYFTDAHRLRFFYDGLRAVDLSASAARGSFRPAPALLLLVTRLPFENSAPRVPGRLERQSPLRCHASMEKTKNGRA
jgi:hypothetical protein